MNEQLPDAATGDSTRREFLTKVGILGAGLTAARLGIPAAAQAQFFQCKPRDTVNRFGHPFG